MKIFNKLRFKTVEGKRLKNYTVYAFGELILVIVGILIALGINNWNQGEQLKDSNLELQSKVLNQIEKDIIVLEDFERELDTLNQTYLKVLGREYDETKVNSSGMLSTVLFEVNTLSLDRNLNNLVDNAELDDSAAAKEIISINSIYKSYLKNVDDVEAVIFQRIVDNLNVLEQTQNWYTELIVDFVCRNDCINYLLEDEGHKSRIASLRFLYISAYGNLIANFLEDLKEARAKLQRLLEFEN